jgi:hypothetical protein
VTGSRGEPEIAQADYRFSLVNMVLTIEFLSIVIVNGVIALLGVLSVRTAILVWIAVQAGECLRLG